MKFYERDENGEIWIEPKATLLAVIISGMVCCIAIFYVVLT
jgi:preprotein translocase subunit Sec61beta